MFRTIGALLLSYVVGGFPTAIIAGKVLRGIDIRDYGSRNAGATNVWRVLGVAPAIAVLLIDAFKGVVAVVFVSRVGASGGMLDGTTLQVLCGLFAIVGHVWTVFARFRGGKGVGTAAGVFGALAPWAVLIALVCFILVVALTRYISAGSIAAALVLAAILFSQYLLIPGSLPLITVLIGTAVAVLVVVKHHSNIHRLLNGTENKFGRPASVAFAAESTPGGSSASPNSRTGSSERSA